MMLIALIIAGVVFYEVFIGLRTVAHIQSMSAAGRSSLAVIQDKDLDDDAKAVAMRRASGAMFSATGLMVVKTVLAVLASGVVLWLAAFLIPAWTFEDLLAYSVSWIGLGSVIIALIIYGKMRHGRG